jgi:hypothetical protein
VGDRFGLRGLLLDRCGPKVGVGRVVVGEIRKTRSDYESFHWRDVGCIFRLSHKYL